MTDEKLRGWSLILAWTAAIVVTWGIFYALGRAILAGIELVFV